MTSPTKAGSRSHARKALIQTLYQRRFHPENPAYSTSFNLDLDEENSEKRPSMDQHYFDLGLETISKQAKTLDALMQPLCDHDLSNLTHAEHVIMLVACYELRDCPDIPFRVVINEALNLTKEFGAPEAFKLVNSVLDRLAKQLRPLETG